MPDKLKSGNKFCNVCGSGAEHPDVCCRNCGYAFKKKSKKRALNWTNLILILIILTMIYSAIRYANNLPLVPW